LLEIISGPAPLAAITEACRECGGNKTREGKRPASTLLVRLCRLRWGYPVMGNPTAILPRAPSRPSGGRQIRVSESRFAALEDEPQVRLTLAFWSLLSRRLLCQAREVSMIAFKSDSRARQSRTSAARLGSATSAGGSRGRRAVARHRMVCPLSASATAITSRTE
jgi:hypothetical protein